MGRETPYNGRSGSVRFAASQTIGDQWYDSCITTGNIIRGKREGLWTVRYPNGQIAEKANFKRGFLHGEYHCWYDDGTLMAKGQFKKGRGGGKLLVLHRNGTPIYEEQEDESGNILFTGVGGNSRGNFMFKVNHKAKRATYCEFESSKEQDTVYYAEMTWKKLKEPWRYKLYFGHLGSR